MQADPSAVLIYKYIIFIEMKGYFVNVILVKQKMWFNLITSA